MTISGMTWVNQGDAHAADGPDGSIALTVPAEEGDNYHLLVADLGKWGAITAQLEFSATECVRGGLFLRESASGKLRGYGVFSDPGSICLATWLMDSPTSAPDLAVRTYPDTLAHIWLRITASGANYIMHHSLDGSDWVYTWPVSAPYDKNADGITRYHDQWGIGLSAIQEPAAVRLVEFTQQ